MTRPSFLVLLLVSLAFGFQDPAPTQEQQNAILGNVGDFTTNYLNTLPNLICTRTTEQFKGSKQGDRWKRGDTLEARLTVVADKEQAQLLAVNGAPLSSVRRTWKQPLLTGGEFGNMLATVLSQGSNASLSWKGWETLNGHHVAVFNYAIDKQHSGLSLSLLDLARAVLAYTGSIYVDPQSGSVWRVTTDVTDIPKELKTLEMQTVLDYGEVDISGKTYLLPVHETALERSPQDTMRNEITYANYRKFEAESNIKFDTADPGDKQVPPAPQK